MEKINFESKYQSKYNDNNDRKKDSYGFVPSYKPNKSNFFCNVRNYDTRKFREKIKRIY